MPFKGGLTYEDVRTKCIRKGLKNKDINSILWQMLKDCFEDLAANKEPRYGKTAMTFILSQLSQLDKAKKNQPDENRLEAVAAWLDRAAS